MQTPVRSNETTVNPTLRSRRVRTSSNHVIESEIHTELKPAQRAAQRAADMDSVWEENAARIRRPPPKRYLAIGQVDAHGEHPGPVGGEHGARGQIGTDTDQLLHIGRAVGVWQLPLTRLRFNRFAQHIHQPIRRRTSTHDRQVRRSSDDIRRNVVGYLLRRSVAVHACKP